jgi:hypothetical protein
MNRVLILVALLFAAAVAGASIYPAPTNVSFGGIIAWAQPLIAYSGTLPTASQTAGDLYILASTPVPLWYRWSGTAWVMVGGSGTGGTSSDASVATLGGDLSGTVATATVAKLQGRAVAATTPATYSVLMWDGSTWSPSAAIQSIATTTVPGVDAYDVGTLLIMVDPTASTTKLLRLTAGSPNAWRYVAPVASDSTVGTSRSLDVPCNPGVSSYVLTIKDGLITQVVTP